MTNCKAEWESGNKAIDKLSKKKDTCSSRQNKWQAWNFMHYVSQHQKCSPWQYLVSCPNYLSEHGGKNGLVNGLFCFRSKDHNGCTPIRLFHVSDIKYCNKWRLKRARLGSWSAMRKTKPENRQVKECQDVCEWAVCVSELANWQCEISELQMSSKIVLESLWGSQRFRVLWIWRSEALRKMITITSRLLHSFIVVSNIAWRHIIHL